MGTPAANGLIEVPRLKRAINDAEDVGVAQREINAAKEALIAFLKAERARKEKEKARQRRLQAERKLKVTFVRASDLTPAKFAVQRKDDKIVAACEIDALGERRQDHKCQSTAV